MRRPGRGAATAADAAPHTHSASAAGTPHPHRTGGGRGIPETAAPCAGVPPSCRTDRRRHEALSCSRKYGVLRPLLRLMRKEIELNGPGCGPWIPIHGPHPAYPHRVRSRTIANRRRTSKTPHGLHSLFRWLRNRTRRRTAFRPAAGRGEAFHLWPKPRGDVLLRFAYACEGELQVQGVGVRCCVSMSPDGTFPGCGWPPGRTRCGRPFSAFTG